MFENNKSIIFLIVLLPLIAIVLSGCAYYGTRVSKTFIKITPESISTPKLNNSVNVSVSANIWYGEPKNLKKHITPFYIEIKNKTGKNILISEADFVLFDEFRNQYNPLPPNRVANILKSAHRKRFYRYPRVSIGIGTSFHHDRFHYYGHHHYPFYRPFYRPYHYFDDYPYYRYRRSYYEPDLEDVFSRYLNPGAIRPNANISGYIYFKKIAANTKELTLEIGYKIMEDNTTHKLDFHFDLVEVSYK
jgi:hypothetical protein